MEEIDHMLSLADRSGKVVEQNEQRSSRLRQSILQRGFSGNLVMGQVSDDPVQLTFDI